MGKLLMFPQPIDFGARFSERVLDRLWQARDEERNHHLLDDLIVAWQTVSLAAQGSPIPFVEASYNVLGCHPDYVFQRLMARRRWNLGLEYSLWFDDAGNLRQSYLDIPDFDPTSELAPWAIAPKVGHS